MISALLAPNIKMRISTFVLLFLISIELGFSQSRIIEIPSIRNSYTTYLYNRHHKKISALGLDNLRRKSDSINFRFWTDRQILDFKLDRDGHLTCDLYSFVMFKKLNKNNSKSLKYLFHKYILDDKNADYLWKMINSLGLLNMSDGLKIPNYSFGLDGYSYITELSTDSIYKFATYWCPEVMSKSVPEAKRIVDFLTIANVTLDMKNRSQRLLDDSPVGEYTYDESFYWIKRTKNK